MFTDANSIEIDDKIKLPPSETLNQLYNLNRNRKGIRVLTVAVYVLSVSLTAIILSIYYLFVWDPNELKTFTHPPIAICDKIVIPELIAIQLFNSSTEISAEEFYKRILYHHRQVLMEEQNKQKLKLWQLEQKQLQLNIMLHQQKFMNYSDFHKNVLIHHHQQLLNNNNKQNLNKTLSNNKKYKNSTNEIDKNGNLQYSKLDNDNSELNLTINQYFENQNVEENKSDNETTYLSPIAENLSDNKNIIESDSIQSWFTIMPELNHNFSFANNFNIKKIDIELKENSNSNIYLKDNTPTSFLITNFSNENISKSNNIRTENCNSSCSSKTNSLNSISRVTRSKSLINPIKIKSHSYKSNNNYEILLNNRKKLGKLKRNFNNIRKFNFKKAQFDKSQQNGNIYNPLKKVITRKNKNVSFHNSDLINYKNIIRKLIKSNLKKHRKNNNKLNGNKIFLKNSDDEDYYNIDSSGDSVDLKSKTIR